jgi:hypothetical protein
MFNVDRKNMTTTNAGDKEEISTRTDGLMER